MPEIGVEAVVVGETGDVTAMKETSRPAEEAVVLPARIQAVADILADARARPAREQGNG